MVQKPNKWVERQEFTSIQQNDDEIDEYLVRLQTKIERCDFNASKEERIREQILRGLKSSEEIRNLISKPSLTLKIAIESIRTYEATMKDNTRYKDLCEIKDGIINEIKTKQCTRFGKSHLVKTQDCYTFNKQCRKCQSLHQFEDNCLTKTHIWQRRKHSPQKEKKRKPIQNRKKKPTQISLQAGYETKKMYRDETNSETDSETGLLLYTVRENNREEVFANINYEGSRGEKHEIRMKVDTGANGNIIPLKIYQKNKCTHEVSVTKWKNQPPLKGGQLHFWRSTEQKYRSTGH